MNIFARLLVFISLLPISMATMYWGWGVEPKSIPIIITGYLMTLTVGALGGAAEK